MSGHTATQTLLPCPFCGSPNVDPEGWMSVNQDGTQKETGPACDECGGSTESVERWNTRANSHAELVKALQTAQHWMMCDPEYDDEKQFDADLALVDAALAKATPSRNPTQRDQS